MALLEVDGLRAGYGETEVLHDVSIRVEDSEFVTVIGPNGSGKSTLMKAICGVVTPSAGSIRFRGEELGRLSADRIVLRGLSYVPQTENVFPSLTVTENLEMGAFVRHDGVAERIGRMFDLFPDLAGKRGDRAGRLSGGQRQMLALARALMLDPALLLLDEPSAGLSPGMVESVFEQIAAINRAGVSVLMVEQSARRALGYSSRGYVLATGEVRLEDTGARLLSNPEVARLYLGGTA